MENHIEQIAERIRGLRQMMELSVKEMAAVTGTTEAEYADLEAGKNDFTFTFLFKCANRFGVDITELLTGEMPKLTKYEIVRAGEGMPYERRKGFKYSNLAYLFKTKKTEPLLVLAKFDVAEQNKEIALSTHDGEEFNYILKGSLKFRIGDKTEILNEGDSVYYNSSNGHGMIAANGKDCEFLAIVINKG